MAISREARERGLRVRDARRAYMRKIGQRVSQTEFAVRLTRWMWKHDLRKDREPIHQTAVSRWESGRTTPSFAEYQGIAGLTGEDVCWLAFAIPSADTYGEFLPATATERDDGKKFAPPRFPAKVAKLRPERVADRRA